MDSPTPAPTPSASWAFALDSAGFWDVFILVMLIMLWCCVLSVITLGTYTVGACLYFCCQSTFRYVATSWPFYCFKFRRGPSLISTIPNQKYSDTEHFAAQMDPTCTICLAGMELEDQAKEIECRHAYHSECLDSWLLIKPTCPVSDRTSLPCLLMKVLIGSILLLVRPFSTFRCVGNAQRHWLAKARATRSPKVVVTATTKKPSKQQVPARCRRWTHLSLR